MNTNKIEKATYSIAEVAKVLGIGKSLAYEMAHAGKIPVIKFGKRMVVPKSKLEKMLIA
ncbi:MAG: helix-turn-helix domain-containing protein [Peptostreptococcaceae bacterium]|jgi:excisionase family DNA binding protein|nr:helix-turn-helix domain-containing protein [Peptostreptococcaceae bacterium]